MRIQSHRSAHTISLLCNPSPILSHVTSLTPHSSSLIPHLFSLLPHPSPLFPNLSIIPPSSPTPHLCFLNLPLLPHHLYPHPSSLILSPIPLLPLPVTYTPPAKHPGSGQLRLQNPGVDSGECVKSGECLEIGVFEGWRVFGV